MGLYWCWHVGSLELALCEHSTECVYVVCVVGVWCVRCVYVVYVVCHVCTLCVCVHVYVCVLHSMELQSSEYTFS